MSEKRTYLLPKDNNLYRANLHCHSNASDGVLSPQQIKEAYKSEGYSVVAFCDHEKVIPHTELEDDSFVPLTAVEIGIIQQGKPRPITEAYHMNFYAKNKFATTCPALKIPLEEREYSVKNVNDLIKESYDAGFLCQLNHPRWSRLDSNDIKGICGLASFEVFNSACEMNWFNGEGVYEYELYLRSGGRSSVAACDDNHDPSHHFGGWTWVSAPKLTYSDIITAIENGDTYASTGPKIEELYIESDTLRIKCSPVARVGVFSESRLRSVEVSDNGDDKLTDVCLKIDFPHEYIRVEIIDSKGKKAWTRAYFNA